MDPPWPTSWFATQMAILSWRGGAGPRRRLIVSIASLASGIASSRDAAALGSGTGVANQAINSTRAGRDRSRTTGSAEDSARTAGPRRGRRRVVNAKDGAKRSAASVGAARPTLDAAGNRADPGVWRRRVMDARQAAVIAETVGAARSPHSPAGLGTAAAPRRPAVDARAVAAIKDADAAAPEVHQIRAAVSERRAGMPEWRAPPEPSRTSARRAVARLLALALCSARRTFPITAIEIRNRATEATVTRGASNNRRADAGIASRHARLIDRRGIGRYAVRRHRYVRCGIVRLRGVGGATSRDCRR
jgi:hypothetical protein